MPIHSTVALTRDLDTPLTVTPLRHHLVSGDALGDRFDIAVVRGGEAVPLTGAEVAAYFIRSADGYTVPIPGSASGNVATVTLPPSCYTVPGRFTLTVKALLSGVHHALWVGEGAVLRATTEALIDPEHSIPDIDELLAMIAPIERATDAARTAATDANAASASAEAASQRANNAASSAEAAAEAAKRWDRVTATVTMLGAEEPPVVTVADASVGKHITFRIPRGLTGLTPSLRIGSVTTGEPGTSARATLTGTPEAPVLDLTIPRGDVGRIESLTINGVETRSGTITLAPADLGAVDKTGDTMSGNLTVEKTAPRVIASNADTGTSVDLRMTTSGDGGIYGNDSWIARRTASGETRFFGSADTLTTPRKIAGVEFDGSKDIPLTPADVGAVAAWKAGDTVSLSNVILNGYVTSSTANMYVGLSLGKPVDAASITIEEMDGEIRSAQGNVTSGRLTSGGSTLLDLYTVTVYQVNKETGNVTIRLQNSQAFEGVSNNTVVSVRASTMRLRFA